MRDSGLSGLKASGQDFVGAPGAAALSAAGGRFGVDEAKSAELSWLAVGIHRSSAFATPASSKAAPVTTAIARRVSAARF
jgi:hypothetical protein